MTLREGDVLQIPLIDRSDAKTVRIHALVVDEVRRHGDEPLYCFRDQDGPAICLRASRLARLRQRLGADASAALEQLPVPAYSRRKSPAATQTIRSATPALS